MVNHKAKRRQACGTFKRIQGIPNAKTITPSQIVHGGKEWTIPWSATRPFRAVFMRVLIPKRLRPTHKNNDSSPIVPPASKTWPTGRGATNDECDIFDSEMPDIQRCACLPVNLETLD